jgi:hypothetical protein
MRCAAGWSDPGAMKELAPSCPMLATGDMILQSGAHLSIARRPGVHDLRWCTGCLDEAVGQVDGVEHQAWQRPPGGCAQVPQAQMSGMV